MSAGGSASVRSLLCLLFHIEVGPVWNHLKRFGSQNYDFGVSLILKLKSCSS